MSIITISRGTFSGGKLFAESLSGRLGYRCIDRDALLKKAATPRAAQSELLSALEQPPAIPGRFNHKRYIYLAVIQATLLEEVRPGRTMYHGLAGQLLLRGVPGLLRLRIIAPMEFRIRQVQDLLKLGASQAASHIEKIDQDRRQWSHFLYGVDWGNPALYDLVINLEAITIEQACLMVASLVEQGGFEWTPERQAVMNDLALASRVRAELAVNPFTSNLEVDVRACGGAVSVRGDLYEESEDVQRVALAVPGVTGLSVEVPATPVPA